MEGKKFGGNNVWSVINLEGIKFGGNKFGGNKYWSVINLEAEFAVPSTPRALQRGIPPL